MSVREVVPGSSNAANQAGEEMHCGDDLLLVARGAGWRRRAGTAPKPPTPQRTIEIAIESLEKEYAAAQKGPAKSALREHCDYFVDHPAPDLKPEAILAAVQRDLPGDQRAASYVRWQLLSGLPAPIDQHNPRLLAEAIDAYRKAPLPLPHFGLTPADQAQLNSLAASARREEDVAINSRVEQAVQNVMEANRYLIAYRDEFYHRLPKTPQTFLAAFVDADQRLKVAAGVRDWMPTVINDVYNWMGTDAADPQSCATLANAVAELRFRAAPPYYDKVVLGKQSKLTWEKKSDSANPEGKLPVLQQALLEAARRPRAPTHSASPGQPAGNKPRATSTGVSATQRSVPDTQPSSPATRPSSSATQPN